MLIWRNAGRRPKNVLAHCYLKKYNITSQKQPTSQNGQTDIGGETGGEAMAGAESVPFDEVSNITEPTLEEINQDEGVADYLFNGDINLTEYQMERHFRKQLEMIERSLTESNMTRHKRQMDSVNPRWPNNQLFYEFHSSTNTRFRNIVKQALNYISGRTCITFTQSASAPNRVQVGIAAHEFMHALGSWHMHMRGDRDDFIIVDLTNVPLVGTQAAPSVVPPRDPEESKKNYSNDFR
ncbi:astacin [Cooperia oncophora]